MSPGARAKSALYAAGHALASRPVLLTLGFGALYLATFDSEMGSPDENHRYNLGVNLARDGLKALKRSGFASKYPPLQSLLAAPLMKLGLWLDNGADGLWTHRLGLSLSLMACVALVPLFWYVARLLDVPARRAAVATALFGITNPIWPYSKRFFSEPLTALLAFGSFAGALAYVRGGRRLPLVLGLACLAVLPVNNMIVPVAMGLALGVMFLVEGRRRAIWGIAVATVVGAGLVAGSFWLRFGKLTNTGYNNEGFWFKVLDGLHGLLLGWGRSVFLFAPLLILSVLGSRALWRRSRGAAAAMLTALGATLLIVANWWCWWGGICWGPRLVLPVLPLASVGAAALLAEPRRWKTGLALGIALFGLYVQAMGFSFKHDFDIYFWMNGDYQEERKAWFELDHSALCRMPRHFREHPWDLSSSLLTLVQTGPSIVELGQRPVRRVEIVHRGDALIYNWSIADVFAVVREGELTRRIPAGQLGARLLAFNGPSGSAALDGDPATRWSTGRKRLDGMWVRLELERVRDDLVRLELEHMPYDRDFPNGLSARVQADGPDWKDVPARAATPRLQWSPLLYAFAGLGLVLALLSLRREREAQPSAQVP
ncbi:MAG: hypothetical protein HY901_03175 [Deltaproteobacteria bacterium]|nr:hypothetical protein [Deltaproteobacteria bacterium]